MKKVLHLFPRFAMGGAERLVWHYARLLSESVFQVAVGSTVEDGELRQEFEKIGVKLFVGSRQKQGGRFGVWRECQKFVRAWQPNILHTHLLGGDLFGYFLKKKFNLPWIATLHNVEYHTSWPRRLVWKIILRRADKIIAVGEHVYNYALQEFKLTAEKLVLIKNGIDLNPWQRVSPTSLADSKLRLAVIGRLWEQKGHQYLLTALAQVNFPCELHIFGAGPLAPQLKQQAENLKIDNQLTWHGVQANIPQALANIDVVVQPSLWEGMSLVVMEAMAAGKLVVASPAAAQELIQDKITGLVASPAALASILQWVFEHREEARAIAAAGRKYAKNTFDIKNNVRAIEEIYKMTNN